MGGEGDRNDEGEPGDQRLGPDRCGLRRGIPAAIDEGVGELAPVQEEELETGGEDEERAIDRRASVSASTATRSTVQSMGLIRTATTIAPIPKTTRASRLRAISLDMSWRRIGCGRR